MKTIVFDFDKTITENDTYNLFLYHFGKYRSCYLLRRVIYVVVILIRKIRVISNLKQKQIGLNLFVFKKDIDDQYKLEAFCKNITFKKNILDLIEIKSKNSRIIICSASPEIYIKILFPDYEVIGLTFTTTGRNYTIQNHPYLIEKYNLLHSFGITQIDEFYTDSYSDRYVAEISRLTYIVTKNKLYLCDNFNLFEKHFKRFN